MSESSARFAKKPPAPSAPRAVPAPWAEPGARYVAFSMVKGQRVDEFVAIDVDPEERLVHVRLRRGWNVMVHGAR